MIRVLHYTIPACTTHQSIESYLTLQGYSRPILIHLKKTPGGVLLNGKWAYLNTVLCGGEHLQIILAETGSSNQIVPVALPLSIVYEDADLLVVNKPANMPIHPSKGNQEHTLANIVCDYFNRQNTPCTFRCVNRLDRDTTGLTILAKHMLSSALLNRAMSMRMIHREYIAIVYGKASAYGTIDAPIGRKTGNTIERQIDFDNGETAVTHFKTIAYRDGLSLVSLHLETGRTHQIRVHMKSIGHPLLGDFLYHADDTNSKSNVQACPHAIKRQALHACRLQFVHPILNLPMELCAPLPDDMAHLFPEYDTYMNTDTNPNVI